MKLTIGFKTKRNIEVGGVMHLKVISLGPVVQCEDVTPLTGAEIFYTCIACGICDCAKKNGGLPAGWSARLLENGQHVFFCDTDCVTHSKYCRVCGCTEDDACEDDGTGKPCHWVERDLCSKCWSGKEAESSMAFTCKPR